MVKVGEETGALQRVLEMIGDYEESRRDLTLKVRNDLTYPCHPLCGFRGAVGLGSTVPLSRSPGTGRNPGGGATNVDAGHALAVRDDELAELSHSRRADRCRLDRLGQVGLGPSGGSNVG